MELESAVIPSVHINPSPSPKVSTHFERTVRLVYYLSSATVDTVPSYHQTTQIGRVAKTHWPAPRARDLQFPHQSEVIYHRVNGFNHSPKASNCNPSSGGEKPISRALSCPPSPDSNRLGGLRDPSTSASSTMALPQDWRTAGRTSIRRQRAENRGSWVFCRMVTVDSTTWV